MYSHPMPDNTPPALVAVKEAARVVRERTSVRPQVGLILGSGLGRLAKRLESPEAIAYSDIPGMPIPGVAGHSGTLHVGRLSGAEVACLEGRVHLYEGHRPETVVFGARLLAELGCRVVVLTNAAGATTTEGTPGSLLLIADHLNLTGQSPLVGYRHPTEFLDVSNLYDADLRKLALEVARTLELKLREGVYAGLTGPSYETKAEVRYLARIGADAVGMSTVLESLSLADARVKILAFSCLTNAAAGVAGAVLDHHHVQAVAHEAAKHLESIIVGVVARLGEI